MKRFLSEHLELSLDLFKNVDAVRRDACAMPEHECRLLCEKWVYSARALLSDDSLRDPDRQACLWVLAVVRAIAGTMQLYFFGLSRDHHDDWASRARAATARILARGQHHADSPAPKRRTKPQVDIPPPEPPPFLPNLAGKTILVVGGIQDPVVLHRFRDAAFRLEWTPRNVRQVQATVERIRMGDPGGVVFMKDANKHASFYLIRDACKASDTPMIIATKGIAAMVRALDELNARR